MATKKWEESTKCIGEDTITDPDEPIDEQIIALARRKYCEDGSLEIDHGAKVSRGSENGAYVQAWVWVDFEDME